MSIRRSCAGQSGLLQRIAASPSSLTAFAPHDGHISGILYGTASGMCSFTDTTSGMTSPALRIIIVSPMQIPFP